ncbi:TRAP transporter small permease subunit [Paracoccus sp. S-4012]|uniref:TRAP transporter small permease n=1 Tax=Paracoccus sp. S-4012 TaxID=2665648 RepID=UPI0012B0F81A|nr:TRAP transporter small permease [Paracoccus sp. S-4012]MRX48875.1 TRAP transporter small permease subunit [Paracoccus sp. S-4012]
MAVKALMRLSQGMTFVAACICLPLILIIMSVDVFNRYFLNAPWTWSTEACSLLLFISVVLALPESWRVGIHIRAEFLRGAISKRALVVIERLVWLLLVILSIALIWQSRIDGLLMILIAERSVELDIPMVWFRVLLAFSALVTGLIGLWGFVTGTIPNPADADFVGGIE